MRRFAFMKSVPLVANGLAALSLFLLVVKALFLNRIPSFFAGAYELGLLVDSILTSVVASYVFYVLVVHFPQAQDRARVRPYLTKHIAYVLSDCRNQLVAIGLPTTGVTLPLVTSAFAKLAPFGEAPMTFVPDGSAGNWLQYFEYWMAKTERSIARVVVQLPFLEAELVALLTAIDDSAHFEHLRMMGSGVPVGNADLTAWAPSFFEYYSSCEALRKFAQDSQYSVL